MAQRDTATVAAEFIDAFNTADWQRFKATLAPDVRYQETGTQRRVQGIDDYVQLCQGWKQAFPDATGTVLQRMSQGNTVAQEIIWEGTHTGPLVGPGGELPASGKAITVEATIWLTFAVDKIQEIHHHLDLMTMLQQIGALPSPGPAQEAIG